MFGYIKPFTAELKVKENEFYKSLYCGMCRTLGRHIGCFSDLTLNYDFVFLALVRASVTGESFSVGSCRCVANPFRKRKCVEQNDSMRYAAAVGALLAYYKVKDNIADSNGIRKLPFYFVLPFASAAKRRALKHDIPANEIRDSLNALHELEKVAEPSADKPADIFGVMLEAVFSHGVDDAPASAALGKIGYHIGRWVYLIDAADDYEKDIKSRSYNPFAATGRYNKNDIYCALEMELASVDKVIDKIEIKDSGISNIIRNILFLGTEAEENRVLFAGKNTERIKQDV